MNDLFRHFDAFLSFLAAMGMSVAIAYIILKILYTVVTGQAM